MKVIFKKSQKKIILSTMKVLPQAKETIKTMNLRVNMKNTRHLSLLKIQAIKWVSNSKLQRIKSIMEEEVLNLNKILKKVQVRLDKLETQWQLRQTIISMIQQNKLHFQTQMDLKESLKESIVIIN